MVNQWHMPNFQRNPCWKSSWELNKNSSDRVGVEEKKASDVSPTCGGASRHFVSFKFDAIVLPLYTQMFLRQVYPNLQRW